MVAAGLRRLFDLRPGEGRMVTRSALSLFGLIAGHTLLETARDALFLGKLPVSRLTWVYALLAVLSLFAARLNTRFVSAFGRRNSLITTAFIAAFGTVLLYLLEPSQTVVFALYVWSGLLGSILVVQFWMLVGHVFTVAQGKRLFGLLAAGGVLGAVVGASFAAVALGTVGVRQLLVIAAGLFLLTGTFVTLEDVDVPDPVDRRDDEDSGGTRNALSGALGLVTDYPYLVRLSLLIAISTSAVLATDYLFKAHAAATRSPEELGSFFATYYAVLNSVALVVQVFLSSTLIRRMGVIGAFLILPMLLVVGGGTTLLVGGAAAILATKGADGALRHSLHRISTELLWMPLPEHIRNRAKGLVDTVVVRITQAVIALGLFALSSVGWDDPITLASLVMTLAALWLVVGLGLRHPYLNLFRAALAQPSARGRLELDLRSVEVVVESLSSREPESAIAGMELLVASRRRRLIPALILYHESKQVLLRALELVPIPERSDWVPLADRLLAHEDEEIRVAALEALARNGHTEALKGRLLDISPWVRSHAAFWLVASDPNLVPAEDEDIRLLIDMPGESGTAAQTGLLEAIEASGDDRWADLVLRLAESEEDKVARAAVRAMTKVQDPRFVPWLIQRLGMREGRSTVREAIAALGEPAFEALVVALRDHETEARVLVHIPAALARFADHRAAEVLMDTLEAGSSGRVRYNALRALVLLAARTNFRLDEAVLERRMLLELREHFHLLGLHRLVELDLEAHGEQDRGTGGLLVGLLGDKRDQAFDRVFLLLQAAYPEEDLRSVRSAARSADPKRRAQAQEFLDALTLSAKAPELRPLLRLAVDDLDVDDRLTRVQDALGPQTRDFGEALQILLQDPDTSISGLAAYHVLESGRSGLHEQVIEAAHRRPLSDSLRVLLDAFASNEEAPSLA